MTHEEIIGVLRAASGERVQTGKREWLKTLPRRQTVACRTTSFRLPDGRGLIYFGCVAGGEATLAVGLQCLPAEDDRTVAYLPVWQIYYPHSVLPEVPLEDIQSIPQELISTLWPDEEI